MKVSSQEKVVALKRAVGFMALKPELMIWITLIVIITHFLP